MSMVVVRLDTDALRPLLEVDRRLRQEAERAAKGLMAMTHAHVVEQAQAKLHSRLPAYLDALSYFEEDGVYVVQLDGRARWIEEGMEAHSLLDDLLRSGKAKRAKDGSTYVVVPFVHAGGPTQTTPAQQKLIQSARSQLRQQGIPWAKLERGERGEPKLGMLHKLNLTTPNRPDFGRGQGRGPVGVPMQGWSPDGQSGTPLLQGAQVRQFKALDRRGKERTQRAVVTYRVASSKHRGDEGRWQHPGLEPLHLFEEAGEWAERQWAENVVPALLKTVAQAG